MSNQGRPTTLVSLSRKRFLWVSSYSCVRGYDSGILRSESEYLPMGESPRGKTNLERKTMSYSKKRRNERSQVYEIRRSSVLFLDLERLDARRPCLLDIGRVNDLTLFTFTYSTLGGKTDHSKSTVLSCSTTYEDELSDTLFLSILYEGELLDTLTSQGCKEPPRL